VCKTEKTVFQKPRLPREISEESKTRSRGQRRERKLGRRTPHREAGAEKEDPDYEKGEAAAEKPAVRRFCTIVNISYFTNYCSIMHTIK
jgi:hypothetical protein